LSSNNSLWPLVVVCGALAGAAGCGAASTPVHGHSAPQVSATSAASPSELPSSPAQSAVAAYRGMWAEMQRAGVTADWQDPRLGTYASGAALRTLMSGLYKDHQQGIVIRGTIRMDPQVVSASTTRVLLTDCLDASHWLNYIAATGKLQNSIPGGRHLTEAVVTEASGRWTVSQLAVRQVGTC
jgi:hypothetical protein